MIQVGFTTPWSIFTPIVYRMMPREHVDRFFDKGELRISSYTEFRQHGDEQRKDNEGGNIIVGRGSKATTFAVAWHGSDVFVLCGSATPRSELMNSFGCDAAIQIYDTTQFAHIVTRHIPGVRQGFEGYCVYNDGSLECNLGDVEAEQLMAQTGGTIDLNRVVGTIMGIAGSSVFFRKATRFRDQAEYRWVWLVDREVSQPITVFVPEARHLCTPLYLDDVIATEQARANRPVRQP